MLPQYLAKKTKLTGYIERYGLMTIVPVLTALPLLSLNYFSLCFYTLFSLWRIISGLTCKQGEILLCIDPFNLFMCLSKQSNI